MCMTDGSGSFGTNRQRRVSGGCHWATPETFERLGRASRSFASTGPGYRVYFLQRGQFWAFLLPGGDKSTQDQDIEKARNLARDL